MGYEIWDRYVPALIGDWDDEPQALEFLRITIRTLNAEDAARQLDRFQLVRVAEGRETEVISEGVDLFGLIFAPAPAH